MKHHLCLEDEALRGNRQQTLFAPQVITSLSPVPTPLFPTAVTVKPITALCLLLSPECEPLSLLTFYCQMLIDHFLGVILDCLICACSLWLLVNRASDRRLLCRVELVQAGLRNMSTWKFVTPAVMLE